MIRQVTTCVACDKQMEVSGYWDHDSYLWEMHYRLYHLRGGIEVSGE